MWATYAAIAGFKARNVLAALNDSAYGQSNYFEANQSDPQVIGDALYVKEALSRKRMGRIIRVAQITGCGARCGRLPIQTPH